MIVVLVGSIIMDMDGKNHSLKILGKLFLRTIRVIIDVKEVNVKFQFPHNMKIFPRKKEGAKNCPHGMCTS
jgi:hypothetical protein